MPHASAVQGHDFGIADALCVLPLAFSINLINIIVMNAKGALALGGSN